MVKKPELLLPAGNVESFRAALKGGADAVYLGFSQFNARIRANNFSRNDLPALLDEAHKKKVKVYITLNTVVKNKELDELLDLIFFLNANKPDGIIVQDWGVFFLLRSFFPGFHLHASTQMGNHNSEGVEFSGISGFERVVLARELTMNELSVIANKAICELEVFVHGALCYSMSGLCQFSSFIGGRGANRGMCSQSCRMAYDDNHSNRLLFNLKDNQQIENIQALVKIGIDSLKIEGRMKSADYVYQVAKSYRMALDFPEKTKEAEALLAFDFGRDKTSYFAGKSLKYAITNDSNTGIKVGKVENASKDYLEFSSAKELLTGDRIRIVDSKTSEVVNVKIENIKKEADLYILNNITGKFLKKDDEVYLIGRREESFPSRLPKIEAKEILSSKPDKKRINQKIFVQTFEQGAGIYIRIDNPEWLNYFRKGDYEGIILSFNPIQVELEKIQLFVKENRDSIYIELPKFIAEGKIEEWKTTIGQLKKMGLKRFMVSHLSQTLLTGDDCIIYSNEQVLVFNDATVGFLSEQKIAGYCYPVENDLQNLLSMQNRQGIVILHTKPELFYSRMPVKLDSIENKFKDSFNKTFFKSVQNGITIVVPEIPVNINHLKKQLVEQGFSRFMIDLKHETPSLNYLKKCVSKFLKGEQVQPSTIFNFKRGLN